jgi:transposase
MPWKVLSKMDERMRFVARLMEGEKMAVLCREFDISRKTGYKLFNRFKNSGIEGDRSEPPALSARQSPAFSDRELDPAAEGEALELGSSEDPGQD